jgi:hypothetical protein
LDSSNGLASAGAGNAGFQIAGEHHLSIQRQLTIDRGAG